MTEFYDVEKTITSLGIGEALVTVLSPQGVPTPLAATRLLPPDSLMAPTGRGAVPRPDRDEPVLAKYGTTVDRDSAYERITARIRRGRGRRPPTRRCAAGVDADDRGRHEHDDAGPAAARDRPPGAASSRPRPSGRPSGERRGRRQKAGAATTRERQRSDRHGDPDRRQGRHLAARSGHHPRRLRDACSGAARALTLVGRRYSMTRSAGRSGRRRVGRA